MKTTVIKNMKNFSLVAIIMASIIFAACSGDENIISEPPAAKTYTLIVNASKGDVTRALSLDGTTLKATWTMGDAVTVYNVTRSTDLGGKLIAQSDGQSTILSGSLTGTIATGDKLKLKFLSPTYSSQDGTLAGIATTCDYAEATVTVSDASSYPITTSNATFNNQQAIVKFTLKDKSTDAAINATKLVVNAGATTINVTPASATNVLYVAIPSISSQTVYLSAKAGSTNYIYEKSDVTLDNGKYYGYIVSMNVDIPAYSTPLTFEAKEAGAIVTFTPTTIAPATEPVAIEYSRDGSIWKTYSEPITLTNVGDKVSFRGNNLAYGSSSSYSHFTCSNSCYIYGNIMSLISSTGYDTTTKLAADYAFARLFENNTNLYNHSTKKLELPATTLTTSCYESMFSGCTNLTIAPELPATTLTTSCYKNMFYGCTSLSTAPSLLATTLSVSCYESMFEGCTCLTATPELSATTLASSCYAKMFYGCTSLTETPTTLSATTLASSCYANMFYGCTSLTTAPALPATTLSVSCYESMFQGCTSLTATPILPAATLTERCYYQMFKECSYLYSVKCLATDISATDCTTYWLDGVSTTGTFTKATSMTSWPSNSPSGIPSDWTVVSESEVEITSDRTDYGDKVKNTWN